MIDKAQRREGGFSLLELVVAMAIMAMALGVLYRAIGGGVRTVSDTSRYVQAVVLAESVLQLHEAVPAGGWQESGSWESFRWSVATSPFESVAAAPILLHRLQVDVSWADGDRERRFSLVSLRPQHVDGGRAPPR